MLWVLFTNQILPEHKAGLIIMMFISMMVNIGILKLIELRCARKRAQRENASISSLPRTPPPPPTSGSNIVKASTRINIHNNHGVVINKNYGTVNITGTDVWIASEHRKEKQ